MLEAMRQPAEKSKDRHCDIPLKKWNDIQIELMKRSGLNHLEWKEKNSPRFEALLQTSPDLVKLILEDEVGAVLEIERRLETFEQN